ncbi:signal recognition particle, subunit SRP19 (srp19) [Pyrobaculum islandicum DSM 4184]|uniref:Signal recognition particle 19 kDa protein n=1 Tax=Pyrobaculum islandicum (strain DSM 4184 / JCM 9189 / GEO3) TaxID=384616 RepID=SRP19_PYRIL|nr:signal recognition particle subunit SRP19/SEC65 family protein [Pyrobaculum islandicum]A1RS22.1 RecName: Full=Signal recognition particle 19 kDa protein; Short=SRP19 [Pyrobaculum islandicum DSM 4184]ABL87754.1 signal recognition particle, subunit SRP19 (srp19) [Pyrobaculum islandicum DSM 4184]
MKKRGGRILWLVYLDSSVPRSRGRILPRSKAVSKPTLQEVIQALERLGYRYQVYQDKKYPALWFEERQGYIVVETSEKLRILALKVAEEVRKLRR